MITPAWGVYPKRFPGSLKCPEILDIRYDQAFVTCRICLTRLNTLGNPLIQVILASPPDLDAFDAFDAFVATVMFSMGGWGCPGPG